MNKGRNVMAFTLCLIGTILIAYYYFGSPRYAKVSRDAYEVAKAVYAACMAKSEERLGKAIDLIDQANTPASSLTLTQQERDWLISIVQKAEGGQWQVAANMARQIMEDQVKKE